jgi:hypothetical protein
MNKYSSVFGQIQLIIFKLSFKLEKWTVQV